jgi:hypothetical protein
MFVFTGIILIILGLAIRKFYDKKSYKRQSVRVKITYPGNDVRNFQATEILRPEVKNVRTKSVGVNYTFGHRGYPSLPTDAGLKPAPKSELDGLTLTCFDECDTQVFAKERAKAIFLQLHAPEKTLRGDVRLNKRNVEELAPNTRIVGNLYISNLNQIKLPCGFSVSGNIYIKNSKGVRFMGNNLVEGSIFLKGKSSMRALPESVILTGQVFI